MSFQQKVVAGPFKGIVDNLPPAYKPDPAWDDLQNLFVRNGRLIGRPRLNASSTSPDGRIILNLIPFRDLLGNQHNLVLTAADAYMVNSNRPSSATPVWNGPLPLESWDATITYVVNNVVLYNGTTYVARNASLNVAPPDPTYWAPIDGAASITGNPWGYAIINGRVYFSNGTYPGLYADGEATIKGANHPGSWKFCCVLANHLLTANTIEPAPQVQGSQVFPQRVRWSNVGDPNNWDESLQTTAGHDDLLEVPDAITGIASLGRSAYVFRTNGITMVTPTGIGSAPFQFDQITNSPKGVGNYYAYSLDVYGGLSIFVAEQDIYLFDGSSFAAIGGETKAKIFADIDGSTEESVWGTILARFSAKLTYLSYWLSMDASAKSDVPVTWVYSWDDKTWHRFTHGTTRMTALGRMFL